MSFGNLKIFRESLNMTQKEFAESLSLNATTYNNYENGIREPKSDFLECVFKKYKVSSDFLLGLSDVMFPDDLKSIYSNISEEAVYVAKAYDQAEFKNKNMARYALDLPPLKKEDEPSKNNTTHIPDIEKITQEALEFKKAMNKAQLKK
ncbi:MAG: helix-turn-helix transcriptional regulator [Oscillospiraceae bacterium]